MTLDEFQHAVVEAALNHLRLYSGAAELLLLGTALHESADLKYERQIGGGPARGYFQHEPASLDDLYLSWLAYRRHWRESLEQLRDPGLSRAENLIARPVYAAAACRLHYYRRPEALPAVTDHHGLAAYYKRFWNTDAGRARPEDFLDALRRNGLI